MTTNEAAEFLGVNPSRCRQLILEGRLKATKIGRDWHIKEADAKGFKATARTVGRPARAKKAGVELETK